MEIGKKIKRVREIKGFSQSEIAAKLFISQRAYSDLENNKTKIDIDRLKTIAEIFEMPLIDLMTFDDKNIFRINRRKSENTLYKDEKINDSFDIERKFYEMQIIHLEEEIAFLRDILKQRT